MLVKPTLERQYLSAAHKTAYYGVDHWKAKQAWALYFKMKESTLYE